MTGSIRAAAANLKEISLSALNEGRALGTWGAPYHLLENPESPPSPNQNEGTPIPEGLVSSNLSHRTHRARLIHEGSGEIRVMINQPKETITLQNVSHHLLVPVLEDV